MLSINLSPGLNLPPILYIVISLVAAGACAFFTYSSILKKESQYQIGTWFSFALGGLCGALESFLSTYLTGYENIANLFGVVMFTTILLGIIFWIISTYKSAKDEIKKHL